MKDVQTKTVQKTGHAKLAMKVLELETDALDILDEEKEKVAEAKETLELAQDSSQECTI